MKQDMHPARIGRISLASIKYIVVLLSQSTVQKYLSAKPCRA